MNGGAKCKKIEWFWVVKGHSKSWAMSAMDRAHIRLVFAGPAGMPNSETDRDTWLLHL